MLCFPLSSFLYLRHAYWQPWRLFDNRGMLHEYFYAQL
uniref:Uncharacterized protein n=1 Tax=Siphoviridae sp. ctVif31 TaxID=2825532 RepID=A0A8S5Q3E4_9CAUD|nr:MAG TPA: hypothetical protein [Siphoviridae sp. ctVif31]